VFPAQVAAGVYKTPQEPGASSELTELTGISVWPVGLAGGFLPNAAYSVYLLSRSRSWSGFRAPFPGTLWSSLMAILCMA